VADSVRMRTVYLRPLVIGVFPGRHSLAALLSVVAVCSYSLAGLHRNRWGYFIGIAAAGLWDFGGLFVNNFVMSGLRWLMQWIHSGQLKHLDQIIAIPAFAGNFLVVVGCLWGYARLPQKSVLDSARFLAAFVLSTGFFAVAMALFQPRYLALFRGLLHPHWPEW